MSRLPIGRFPRGGGARPRPVPRPTAGPTPGPEPTPTPAPLPSTFTLTTNIETVPAQGVLPADSTVNGVINGAASTYQSGDVINGNATSAVNVTVAVAAASAPVVAVNNIGNVNFRTLVAETVNNILFSGVGAVNSNGAVARLTIQNGELATTYGLSSVTADGDLRVDYRAFEVAGTNDTAKLAVNGTVEGTLIDIASAGANAGIENVSIATSGTNNFRIDRGTNARDGILTVTGSGVNVIDVDSQFVTGSTYVGLGGTNTLVIDGAINFVSDVGISGFSALTLDTATTGSILLRSSANFSALNLLADANTNVNINGAGNPASINLIGAQAANATSTFGALSLTGSYASAFDTVAINVGNGGVAKTGATGYTLGGDLVLNGAEAINLSVTDIASTGVTALSAGAITSSTLSSFRVTTPGNLTGAGGDIVPGATTLSALDFSGVAGTASIGTQTFNAANGAVITGSVGAFTAVFDGLDTVASTYTFNGAANVDTVDFTGSAGKVNINTFAANDVIVGATGGGIITPGLGVDSVNLTNAGASTVRFILGDSGLTAATADTITAFATTVDKLATGLFNGTANNFSDGGAGTANFAAALTAANTRFAANPGEIYFFSDNATDGFFFVDYDGNGTADLGLTLAGTTALVAADIIA